jgi:hypothetical protein
MGKAEVVRNRGRRRAQIRPLSHGRSGDRSEEGPSQRDMRQKSSVDEALAQMRIQYEEDQPRTGTGKSIERSTLPVLSQGGLAHVGN